MESYTYLFLFVLQLVFTVVVLLALLHEKRLQKQLEKKSKQLLTELLNLRGEIRAMRSTYLTFTGKIVHISVSTTTASEELKKLISATEKLKKRTGKNQIINGCTERCKGSRREDNGLRSRIWKTERHSSKDSWKETDTDRKCNEHQQ